MFRRRGKLRNAWRWFNHPMTSNPRLASPLRRPMSSSRPDATMARQLVPAASFADVLNEMSQNNDAEIQSWCRPPPPDISEKPSLTFQKLDISEGYEDGHSEIWLFGVTKIGNSLLVRVRGFEHYFYYPSPVELSDKDLEPLLKYLNTALGDPVVSRVEFETTRTASKGKPIRFLKISLADHRRVSKVKDELDFEDIAMRRGQCHYRDMFSSPEHTYEADVPYFLRYMLDGEISALSWLKIPARKYDIVKHDKRVSRCQLEVSLDEQDLLICDVVHDREKYAPLRILSFDIESNIPENKSFPDAKETPVIQIGAMVSDLAQVTPFIRTIFTLGSCSPISGTEVQSFKDEKDMLTAWQKFFVEVDPDVVIGYNITQFDIHYLLERASTLKLRTFPYFGRAKSRAQTYDFSKGRPAFSSCPGYEGRLILDVFHHIRGTISGLPGYKLNDVSRRFLKEKKEDIAYDQIPILQNGDADSRRDLAIYCMKDVYLPLRLFEKLKCFDTEVKGAKLALLPFNTMRVGKQLEKLAKRCRRAIDHEYVLADN